MNAEQILSDSELLAGILAVDSTFKLSEATKKR